MPKGAWKKSGLPIETIEALPKKETRFITAEELLALLQSAKGANAAIRRIARW